MVIKIKKTKKAKGMRGKNSHGHGARKKWKGSGHRGGIGMAGTGKRGDQKKSLVIKKHGNKYFGKKGFTSLHVRKKNFKEINLRDIQENLDSLKKKFEKNGKLELKNYRILGDGEIKEKIEIVCEGVTKSAKVKIEKVGGNVEVLRKKTEPKKIKEIEKK